MKHPHIATGPHMEGRDARFRINTAPGIMEPHYQINEAHGSYLERKTVIELHEELTAWLEAHLTPEQRVRRIVGDALDEEKLLALIAAIAND